MISQGSIKSAEKIIVGTLSRKTASQKETPSPLTAQTRWKDDLGLDSLDLVEVLVGLERQFKIEFDGEEIDSAETIGDLARCVVNRSKKSGYSGREAT